MKIVTIIGARPQFVKAAAFSKKFRKKNIEILVHTGQHYDANMSDVFFEELKIPKPDYNLGVGSSIHGKQTGQMLEKIEEILINEKPDGVLVYGDTNSTIAGALAASKLLIPVFHIEAGLRSFNMDMPEEQNRILTDHISSLLFSPTKTGVKNLKKEGIVSGVFNTGDIMYETVLEYVKEIEGKYSQGKWKKEVKLIKDFCNKDFENVHNKEYYLATIHRPKNTDISKNLLTIFETFNKLDKPVVMPLHPRTLNKIKQMNIKLDNIHVIEPVGYSLMLYLLKNAYMVITDSGGLQKEAYFLRTPCLTLRDETEWPETLIDNWNVLCLIDSKKIIEQTKRNLSFTEKKQKKLFGNGKTSETIIKIIEEYDKNRK